MKYATLAMVVAALVVSTTLAQDPKTAPTPKGESPFKDLKSQASYALGLTIGSDFKRKSIDLDPTMLAKGIQDAMTGGLPLMTDAEVQEVMMKFQQEYTARQQKMMSEASGINKKEGEAFLAKNKTAPGVQTTKSGLQYKIVKSGPAGGKSPSPTDEVSAHYRGTLINGTQFDSSYDRGQPSPFRVNGVIKGWTEALQLMKPGDKWQLFIPSELAYGERPRPGGQIPPNAVLIFDIELISVNASR